MICLWARVAAFAERLRALRRAKSAPARIWTDEESWLRYEEDTRSCRFSTTVSEGGGRAMD